MPTTCTITHNLPEFPYCPATDARRHLTTIFSNSHFVTTVVSPRPLDSASQPRTLSCADREDNADPPQSPPHSTGSSSPEIAAHPPARSQSSKHSPSSTENPSVIARLPSSSRPRSAGIETVRLRSSKFVQAPSPAYSSKHPPVLIGSGQECLPWPPPRRRSAWRRFKRMGNHLVTPLRSVGLCLTSCTGGRRAVALCEDFSADDASPGSSWYSSGDYPPDFIRAVLENNALFGQLTVE